MIESTQGALSHLHIGKRQAAGSEGSDQAVFLRLLTTQMQSQNPLNPQDNTEFVAQLAQFTQVESLNSLNNNFDAFTGAFLSGQALDAANLIGKEVTVKSNEINLSDSDLAGKITVSKGMQEVRLKITDGAGQTVDTIELGNQLSGEVSFHWDGEQMRVNGEAIDWQPALGQLQSGAYKVSASGRLGQERVALPTALRADVERVSIQPNGRLSLHLTGIGEKALSDILEFHSSLRDEP